jgi:hydroxypyruvate reductase
MFRAAIDAARPAVCLPPHLPAAPPGGRLIILAGGKAAGSMAEAAVAHYREHMPAALPRITGLAVTRYGHGAATAPVECVEAGHPVPDAAGVAATRRVLALARSATADDLVLVLLSGGASANWSAPAGGVTLADQQAVTRALLRSGAPIADINTVRRHLSAIKGGRLARAAWPARLVTLAISDVPGDLPAAIGSGPTVADDTTLADARAVVDRFHLGLPASVTAALADSANETVKPGDPALAGTRYQLVATPAASLAASARLAAAAGYEPMILGDALEGEARDVAADHAALALGLAGGGRRVAILSSGELTVTIKGTGRGGPNQEYALALLSRFAGHPRLCALAGDTDGADGGSGEADDPAGAWIGPATSADAGRLGHDPARFLANNDSTGFFEAVGGLVRTGPTRTNVNDFRAILVDRAEPAAR